ncbi:MAG: hypothetical protein GX326_06965 [Clostridiaceae bacterium]|nr:hypothetical protein [Clostridiaceae bacterium]
MNKLTPNQNVIRPNIKIQDSAFTHLFRDPEYALKLYQDLHPETEQISKEQIEYVNLENVLGTQGYNDLGFMVKDKLLIFVESQNTRSTNILMRMLFYMAETFEVHLEKTGQNLDSKKPVKIPKPEFYLIYTGDKKDVPKEIKFSEKYFPNSKAIIEITIDVYSRESANDGIIYEYIRFTEIYKEQLNILKDPLLAITKTIDICTRENILAEYLTKRRVEVTDLMITLYDNDKLLADLVHDTKQEGIKEGLKNSAIAFYKSGLTLEKISEVLEIDLGTLESWINNS